VYWAGGERVSGVLPGSSLHHYITRIVRPNYKDSRSGQIVVSALPERPIPKALAGPGLLSQVLISKYLDHQPLYRQRQMSGPKGVLLSESTLVDWVRASAELLAPLADLIGEVIGGSGYVMADETPIRVLDGPGGRSLTGYYWLHGSRELGLAYYQFRRGSESWGGR